MNTLPLFCPSFNVHKAHAKYLARSLGLGHCIAQEIVAFMYGCHNWTELKRLSGQQYEASLDLVPLNFLEPKQVILFKELVTKFDKTIKESFNSKTDLPCGLLHNLVNDKYAAVEDYQIESVLDCFNKTEKKASDFIESIIFAENTPCRFTKMSHDHPVQNNWIRTSALQQSFYAYYHFNENAVHIKVREWDTGLRIPSNNSLVVNKSWYVDFMVGYIDMLAEQFMQLGYWPVFEFFKIQDLSLSSLTSEYADKNHPKHGIYQLVQHLISKGGALNDEINYNCITDFRGIKVAYE